MLRIIVATGTKQLDLIQQCMAMQQCSNAEPYQELATGLKVWDHALDYGPTETNI